MPTSRSTSRDTAPPHGGRDRDTRDPGAHLLHEFRDPLIRRLPCRPDLTGCDVTHLGELVATLFADHHQPVIRAPRAATHPSF